MSDERKWHILKATLIYGGFTIIIVVPLLASIVFKPDLWVYLRFFVLLAAVIIISVAGRIPRGFNNKRLLYSHWIVTGLALCAVIIGWDYWVNNGVITLAYYLLLPIWVLILTLTYTYRYTKYHQLKDEPNNK